MKKELTGKQMAFARLMAEGKMSASDCYREAYDTTAKPQSVQKLAYRERNKVHVRCRIDYLIGLKDAAIKAKALSSQALVTDKLRKHIEGEIELSSTQVTSVSILAKISGMYIARIEDVTERSSTDIAGDLQRKLSQLALVDDDDVTTEESGVTH